MNGRPHVGTVHLNPAESADGSSMDEWGRRKNLSPKCQLEVIVDSVQGQHHNHSYQSPLRNGGSSVSLSFSLKKE